MTATVPSNATDVFSPAHEARFCRREAGFLLAAAFAAASASANARRKLPVRGRDGSFWSATGRSGWSWPRSSAPIMSSTIAPGPWSKKFAN